VAGCCEHGNETSGSMKCSEVHIQLNDCFSHGLDFSFSRSVIIFITIIIIITITLPNPVAARSTAARLLGLLIRIPPGHG
jgi:hypothetical protein